MLPSSSVQLSGARVCTVMQTEGHVALARLFGPGAAEYSLPPEDADSDPQPDRQRITYDELCDARSAPYLHTLPKARRTT